jgi:enoyl-CoA hydratase/carnithine racemase
MQTRQVKPANRPRAAGSDIVVDIPKVGVKRITLNRPQLLNAFTYDMYPQFIDILRALEHDSKTRVVILTGNGRAFCAGHDVKAGGSPPWIGDPDMARDRQYHDLGARGRGFRNSSMLCCPCDGLTGRILRSAQSAIR